MQFNETLSATNALPPDSADTAAGPSMVVHVNVQSGGGGKAATMNSMRRCQSMSMVSMHPMPRQEDPAATASTATAVRMTRRCSLDGGGGGARKPYPPTSTNNNNGQQAIQHVRPARRRSSMTVRTLDDSLRSSTSSNCLSVQSAGESGRSDLPTTTDNLSSSSSLRQQRRLMRKRSSLDMCLDGSMHSIHSRASITSVDELSVSFHKIEIREYPWILGDNPSVSRGPALQIDWAPAEGEDEDNSRQEFDLEEYESDRPKRREYSQMVIPQKVRQAILERSGYTRSEIQAATKGVNITKQQRGKTLRMLHNAKLEERLERTARAIGSKIGGRKKRERKLLADSAAVETVADKMRAEAWAKEEEEMIAASASD